MIAETGKGRKLFKSFPRDARALNVAICFIAAVRAGTDQGNVESWTPGNAPCDFFKSNLGASSYLMQAREGEQDLQRRSAGAIARSQLIFVRNMNMNLLISACRDAENIAPRNECD